MNGTLVLAACVLIAWTLPVWAQDFGPPEYALGDRWSFTNSRRVQVVAVEGETIVLTGLHSMYGGTCRGCRYYLDRSLTPFKVLQADGDPVNPASFGWFVPIGAQWKFWNFPLSVRSSWRFSGQYMHTNNELHNVDVFVRVDRFEDVSTKAGTFKAFRVHREMKFVWSGSTQYPYVRTDTVWFAPTVKWIVKFTSTEPKMPDYELKAYSVKQE
jgi:hypothetical protein